LQLARHRQPELLSTRADLVLARALRVRHVGMIGSDQ
jgi:hypothetical protein